jgi:hypothetical protein
LENLMSSLVYGIITAKRTAAPAGQSQSTAAPGIGTYIDTLAALVPAEALALYLVIVIPYATQTTSGRGKSVTVISDPRLLQWSCAGLLALCSLLYLVGRQRAPFSVSDVLRFFIPPMAFMVWLLPQNAGVWNIWWPGSSIGERTLIAAFAAVLLGIAAGLLGQLADAMPGVLAVTGVSPNSGSAAGGESVTVIGSGFTGATAVMFGPVAAPSLAFVSDTQIIVTSPRQETAGPVDVTVTTVAGTSLTSPADRFTYKPIIAEFDAVLANWSGEVGAHIETLDGRRVDQLGGDRDYQLVVAFGRTLGEDFEHRSIDVRGGRDVNPVAFELLLDADRVRFPPTGQELLLPVDGDNTTKAYKFKAPHQVGELRMWVQVLQLNRLLQVVTLTVDVVAPDPDA